MEHDVRVSTPADLGVDEPSVAINPADPHNVIIVAQDFGRSQTVLEDSKGLRTYTSFDGGAEWLDNGPIEKAGGWNYDYAADPVVDFDHQGNAYLSYLIIGYEPSASSSSSGKGGLVVSRSTNSGRTWSRPVFVERPSDDCNYPADKNWHTVDQRTGAIYVVWRRSIACPDSPRIGPIYLSKSTNQGRGWSRPVRVSAVGHDFGQGARPVVGPEGTIYVAYLYAVPASPESPCPSVFSAGTQDSSTGAIAVSTSRDSGRTWRHKTISLVCDLFGVTEYYNYIPSYPSLAVDPRTGVAVVSWADRQVPVPKVSVSTSKDAGRSWSEPTIIEPRLGTGGFFPEVGAFDGEIWLFSLEIEPLTTRYDAIMRLSSDTGRTWSQPMRLNTAPLHDCSTGGRRFLGHYMGIDVLGRSVVPAWVECRTHTQGQELWTRPSKPS